MLATIHRPAEIPPPFPPHPSPAPRVPEVHVRPPVVYVEPVWEYRHVERNLAEQGLPGDAELNDLGAKGWELVSVLTDGRAAHFYFKRQAS